MNTNIKLFKLLLLGESNIGAKTSLLHRYIDNGLIYLVGNKIDLDYCRAVTYEEGKSLANDLNMKFFEVSAKTRDGVDNLLEDISDSLHIYK